MNRREMLAVAPCAAAAAYAQTKPRRIIDTHTHFYDTSRARGVPWPPKGDPVLYRPVLPTEYRRMTAKLDIVGAICVEASPWIEDNQWVLDLAEKEPVILGTVGHLEPGKPEFHKQLEHFSRNRRFLGIRIGGYPFPLPFDDLKSLQQFGLQLDLVGDGDKILPAALAISDRIPDLRIVLDHLPFQRPEESKHLPELASRKQIYAKISNVPRVVSGTVREDLAFYKPALDEVYEIFGPDRVLYGSNWPVSDRIAPFEVALRIVHEYFDSKGNEIASRYFLENAKSAYRFV